MPDTSTDHNLNRPDIIDLIDQYDTAHDHVVVRRVDFEALAGAVNEHDDDYLPVNVIVAARRLVDGATQRDDPRSDDDGTAGR